MSVYITNVEKFDISVRSKTLKPGHGDVFPDEAAAQDGVVAFVKKGWLKCEMVKESPDAVSVGVAKPEAAVKVSEPVSEPKPAVGTSEPTSEPKLAPQVDQNKKKKHASSEPAKE